MWQLGAGSPPSMAIVVPLAAQTIGSVDLRVPKWFPLSVMATLDAPDVVGDVMVAANHRTAAPMWWIVPPVMSATTMPQLRPAWRWLSGGAQMASGRLVPPRSGDGMPMAPVTTGTLMGAPVGLPAPS